MTRHGMASLIAAHGHTVLTAETVGEGLARLASRPTHLLVDMHLPDGRGTAVLARVQADGLPVRVGLLSGSDEATLRAETRDLRPDAVFTKPPDWDAVMRWIGG